MRAWLRARLVRARALALGPVLLRLDEVERSLDARLDQLHRHVNEVDALIQVLEGRAATNSERSIAQGETHARLERRVEQIERLLAGPPAPVAGDG